VVFIELLGAIVIFLVFSFVIPVQKWAQQHLPSLGLKGEIEAFSLCKVFKMEAGLHLMGRKRGKKPAPSDKGRDCLCKENILLDCHLLYF